MSKIVEHVAPQQIERAAPKWGRANDKRGVQHQDIAIKFNQEHPIGTVLSVDDFDLWLQENGMLVIPPADTPKNSDAWLGHLQRRHQVRGRINKAATHPRLIDNGAKPFFIAAMGGGFEVRAPHVEAQQQNISKQINHLTQTKRKQLAYLLQSADFESLPVYERIIAEQIYEDIGGFSQQVELAGRLLTQRFDRLHHNLSKAVATGTVRPVNGGIKQLLAPSTDDDGYGED